MDINIKGEPGTGNTFLEIHIGTVQNYNPNATTVINHNYGRRIGAAPVDGKDLGGGDSTWRREEILQYVMRLECCVASRWSGRYRPLWENVLSVPRVKAGIYEVGKQQDTTFNRNLVAGIIYIMYKEGVIVEGSATRLAELLEGTREHSVRHRLGSYPDDSDIRRCVTDIIRNF